MRQDLQTFKIARFALSSSFEDVGEQRIDQLKRHLLDSIGSMIYATQQSTIKKLLRQLQVLGTAANYKGLIPDKLVCDRAAELYTALIRYPDFMDNYLGKEATCHPSDNIGSLLAVAQMQESSGKDFLTAMAVAYQIQCRLVEEIPVMKEGIDHTLLLAYSIVASVSKLLGLTEEQLAHALGIAGCSISPMVTSRASYTYEWKGLASAMDALECINIVLLAQQGVTGPVATFEGPKGFKEVFNMDLKYDWSKESFELIDKCILKRYNAEVHSQSAVHAAIALRQQHSFSIDEIEKVEVTTFLTAYHIIGGGAYGDREIVKSKEQADHSLFYLIAVALIDGDIYPEQFMPGRILQPDVQDLLKKVSVHTGFPLHKPVVAAGMLDPYTRAYPGKMKSKVKIILKNGTAVECEREDYPGFHTRPFDWEQTIAKFKRLCAGIIDMERQLKIIDVIKKLDRLPLTKLLDVLKMPSEKEVSVH